MRPEWNEFVGGKWDHEINVRDFIQKNYHPYDGDESFLAGPTQNTKDLLAIMQPLRQIYQFPHPLDHLFFPS